MIIAYLNNEYLPLTEARVPVMDRGFLFGDAVYEVIPVYKGIPFRLAEHFARLVKSLQEIHLSQAIAPDLWTTIVDELIQRNGGRIDQSIYIQITRGPMPERDALIPELITPTLFAYSKPVIKALNAHQGCKVITLMDLRWKMCHVKATTLLANVLLRQQAKDAHAEEAILINDGYAIEGTSSNLFIVKDGIIITPPLGAQMLGGLTRELVLELAKQRRLPYEERPIFETQLLQADEVWITSSLREIQPVIQINEQLVGQGTTGPICQQMIKYYQDYKAGLGEEHI